jgi:hypothetical protein
MRGIVALLLVALGACAASATEPPGTLAGRSSSTTRSLSDWKGYFASDMGELRSRAETTTLYAPEANHPVKVAGVEFDLRAQSPIHTETLARVVTRQGDPELATVHIEATSTTAQGQVIKTSFSFKEPSYGAPIAVGKFDGTEMSWPTREAVVQGKTFVFHPVTHTTEITALLVAPTFEDLLAQKNLREAREPGTRLESGSLRVLGPDGAPLGFFAGDVRMASGEDYVAPK